jgi:hypothetical protein
MMKYAMALASLGCLLLSAPALATTSHGQTARASTIAADHHDNSHAQGLQNQGLQNQGDQNQADRDRIEMTGLLNQEVNGILHNPHCDPDDQNGPDGDHDDRAANNPGQGRHVGRCHNLGQPASP